LKGGKKGEPTTLFFLKGKGRTPGFVIHSRRGRRGGRKRKKKKKKSLSLSPSEEEKRKDMLKKKKVFHPKSFLLLPLKKRGREA